MNTPTDSRKDGGPAFPFPVMHGSGAPEGLSIRDYFAAKAMHASIGNPLLVERLGANPADVATDAYEYADAMLAARSKP